MKVANVPSVDDSADASCIRSGTSGTVPLSGTGTSADALPVPVAMESEQLAPNYHAPILCRYGAWRNSAVVMKVDVDLNNTSSGNRARSFLESRATLDECSALGVLPLEPECCGHSGLSADEARLCSTLRTCSMYCVMIVSRLNFQHSLLDPADQKGSWGHQTCLTYNSMRSNRWITYSRRGLGETRLTPRSPCPMFRWSSVVLPMAP